MSGRVIADIFFEMFEIAFRKLVHRSVICGDIAYFHFFVAFKRNGNDIAAVEV